MPRLHILPHPSLCYCRLCATAALGWCLWTAPRSPPQVPTAGAIPCSCCRLPRCSRAAAPLQEFSLIDERELAPLKELIDRMVR